MALGPTLRRIKRRDGTMAAFSVRAGVPEDLDVIVALTCALAVETENGLVRLNCNSPTAPATVERERVEQ